MPVTGWSLVPAGLLHIPAAEADCAKRAVDRADDAFAAMHGVADEAIVAFYALAAELLEDDAVWGEISKTNAEDKLKAQLQGRSTTRLVVSDAMRAGMIDGLRGWANAPSQRGTVLETVQHRAFRVEMVGAALGIVAFVFEGRPNVLADACGGAARRQYRRVPHRQGRAGHGPGHHAAGDRTGAGRSRAPGGCRFLGEQRCPRRRLGAVPGCAALAGGGSRVWGRGGYLGCPSARGGHAGELARHRGRLDGGFRQRWR